MQTRITTKYNIPNLKAAKYQRIQKRERDADKDASAAAATDAPRIPRATLTLKTYDPESGVVLKFKTDRAADVGRLVGGLGRVGRVMAALPERAEGMKAREVLLERLANGWTIQHLIKPWKTQHRPSMLQRPYRPHERPLFLPVMRKRHKRRQVAVVAAAEEERRRKRAKSETCVSFQCRMFTLAIEHAGENGLLKPRTCIQMLKRGFPTGRDLSAFYRSFCE